MQSAMDECIGEEGKMVALRDYIYIEEEEWNGGLYLYRGGRSRG